MDTEQLSTPSPAPSPADAPISALGYLGIFLLLMIPGVNLLLLAIWACGGCRKTAKRRMARGLLLFLLVSLIALALLLFIGYSLVKNALSDRGIALDSLVRTATVLRTHGSELADGIKTGDIEAVEDVWSELDTETRTDLLQAVGQSDALSEAIGSASLPTPEEGESLEASLDCGSDEEFRGYIQLAKLKGFVYVDLDNTGLSEEEAITSGFWTAVWEDSCLRASFVNGAVTAEYMSRETMFGSN